MLRVRGARVGGDCVLRSQSPAIPDAIAALLLPIRNRTGKLPHGNVGLTEGNPVTYTNASSPIDAQGSPSLFRIAR